MNQYKDNSKGTSKKFRPTKRQKTKHSTDVPKPTDSSSMLYMGTADKPVVFLTVGSKYDRPDGKVTGCFIKISAECAEQVAKLEARHAGANLDPSVSKALEFKSVLSDVRDDDDDQTAKCMRLKLSKTAFVDSRVVGDADDECKTGHPITDILPGCEALMYARWKQWTSREAYGLVFYINNVLMLLRPDRMQDSYDDSGDDGAKALQPSWR